MIKYYPSFRVKTNLSTNGSEFFLNGAPYSGNYYVTYDGKAYSGINPIVGKNEPLQKVTDASISQAQTYNLPSTVASKLAKQVKKVVEISAPVPYYPRPIQSDYDRGYITRYFVKRINDKGYVTEISELEYQHIENGSANYNVSMYQTTKFLWKLTGPLHKVRISQYDTRAGIVDTNERLVLEAEKTFVGIKDFVGGEYDKFARPSK